MSSVVRAHVYVSEPHNAAPVPVDAIHCRLGDHVQFDYGRLAQYCWRHLDEIDVDLLVLTGAVAFSDRSVTRHRSAGWSRDLHVTIPMHRPESWSLPAVLGALTEVLHYLTGDRWSFEFVRRSSPDHRALQLILPQSALSHSAIVPYSGGLDSFAELRRLKHASPGVTPLLVTTEHGGGLPSAKATLVGQQDSQRQVGVPIRLSVGNHPEPTYRSRTFLFYGIAAIAWKLSRSEQIIAAEPGQGSIGPSMVPFGNEHPYRGTHPSFTSKLSRFLEVLWGKRPSIAHPNIWKTKSMLLRELDELGLLEGWKATRSCSRNVGRAQGRGDVETQCGICGGCMLRRISVYAAGLQEEGAYFWSDLTAESLRHSESGSASARLLKADLDVATYSVLGNAHLAEIATYPSDHPLCEQTAFELSQALAAPLSVVQRSLKALLAAHRADWTRFVATLPSTSWLVELAGGIT